MHATKHLTNYAILYHCICLLNILQSELVLILLSSIEHFKDLEQNKSIYYNTKRFEIPTARHKQEYEEQEQNREKCKKLDLLTVLRRPCGHSSPRLGDPDGLFSPLNEF